MISQTQGFGITELPGLSLSPPSFTLIIVTSSPFTEATRLEQELRRELAETLRDLDEPTRARVTAQIDHLVHLATVRAATSGELSALRRSFDRGTR